MNVKANKRLASQSSGTDLTLSGTIKANKIYIGGKDVTSTVTAIPTSSQGSTVSAAVAADTLKTGATGTDLTLSGNLTMNNDTTTTTTTVQELVTTKYITLPTTVSTAPTVGKLGYLVSQTGSFAHTGYTSGNYITPAGTGTNITAGLWIIFGNVTFTFTSPTSFTKAGVQLTGAYLGNNAALSGAKANTFAGVEYPAAITTNIPSKLTLSVPAYYHNVTNAMITAGTGVVYICANTTYAASALSAAVNLQAIRIA